MNKVIILNRKDSNITSIFSSIIAKGMFLPSLKTLFSLFTFLVFVFAGLYVVQINLMTAETYFMQESQQKIKEISRENKDLEVHFAKLNSLSNIEERINQLAFEKAQNVRYINALDGHFVTKR